MKKGITLISLIAWLIVGCTTSTYKQALYLQDQGKVLEAFEVFLSMAKDGHIRSQYHVGSMLVRGRGVQRNCDEGLGWLYKASDSGDGYASFAISVIATSPIQECSPHDEEMKKRYRERAYDQGYPNDTDV